MKKTLYTLLLATMFPCALANQQYWVEGVSLEKGGWVDADKSKSSQYSEETGWFNNDYNTGDGFLCWAASASDIVTWWHQQNPGAAQLNPDAPSSKDDIWQLFKDNYYNQSGSADHGVNWYINGTMTTVEPYPKPAASTNGGYYTGLTVETQYYDIRQFDPAYKVIDDEIWCMPDDSDPKVDVYLEMATAMKSLITDGYIISLGISGASGGKHATTLWGIETDEAGYLTRMWITDSDDYLNGYGVGLIELECGKINNEIMLTDEIKYGDLYAYGIYSPNTTYQESQFPLKVGRPWYSYDYENGRNDYFYEFTGIKISSVASQNVPEPATGTLSLLALAGRCVRRRRK